MKSQNKRIRTSNNLEDHVWETNDDIYQSLDGKLVRKLSHDGMYVQCECADGGVIDVLDSMFAQYKCA